MEKKRGLNPLVVLFIIVLFGFNLISFFRKDDGIYSSVTGMFIQDLPAGINMSLIAFIAQWVILILVVIFAYTKFLKHRKEEEEKVQNFVIPAPKSKAETNLDIFYNLLKEKKSLSMTTISKLFKITKEKALEWAKILEDHDLAIIEYPAFSDAEIRIKEEEKEIIENEKEK